jgi:hypothetical protein
MTHKDMPMRFRFPVTVALALLVSAGPAAAQSFEWRAGQDRGRETARIERLAERMEKAAHDRALRASRAADRASRRVERAMERMVERIERRAINAGHRLHLRLHRHWVARH